MNATLNNVRYNFPYNYPCEGDWGKLLSSLGKTQADDEPLPLRHVLDTLGVEDAIWALRFIEGADREIRLFACDCAERVLPIYEAKYPGDMRPRKAIESARKYANGEAAGGILKDAPWAIWGAAKNSARSAARAAWHARRAKRDTVDAERRAQTELFIKYFCQQ